MMNGWLTVSWVWVITVTRSKFVIVIRKPIEFDYWGYIKHVGWVGIYMMNGWLIVFVGMKIDLLLLKVKGLESGQQTIWKGYK